MTQTATIHNVETGEIEIRPLTDAEIAQLEKDKLDAQAAAEAKAQVNAAKAALLEKLGITEEEAKLLLG